MCEKILLGEGAKLKTFQVTAEKMEEYQRIKWLRKKL